MERFTLSLGVIAALIFNSHCCYGEAQKPAYLDTSLPIEKRVDDLISRMTLEEKVSQLTIDSQPVEHLGIPAYNWRGECLHGVWAGENVTCFPQAIGMAATFNDKLILDVATAISDEARAQYHYLESQGKELYRAHLSYWTPNINLFRDPRWGRGQETYGEDPYLTTVMGVNFVRGLQGNDPKYLKVLSAPKHFAVHSGPDPLRYGFEAKVDAHDFWDSYMPHFEAVIREADAAGIMAAYSGINGTPCHICSTLLKSILRDQWGFTGFVVSDGTAVTKLHSGHKIGETQEEAGKMAFQAGCDMENPPATYQSLIGYVRSGAVSEKDIDRSLRNVLTVRFRLGVFDPPEMVPYTKLPYSLVGCEKHTNLTLQTARESIVLLKNSKDILPISPGKYRKIALIGPFGEPWNLLCGNYFNGKPGHTVSVLQGIREAAGSGTEVTYTAGCSLDHTEDYNPSPIPSELLTPANAKPGEHGLLGEYFDNARCKGKPVYTRIDPQVDFDWQMGSPAPGVPADGFSVRWTGTFTPNVSGAYRLVTTGDDGIRLFIDGKQVIDDWSKHPERQAACVVDLEAGKQYALRLEYFDDNRHAIAKLGWEPEKDVEDSYAEAIKAAKDADLAIVTVGLAPAMATEMRDWPSYALPEPQQKMLEAVKKTGKPMVVVLISGNPIDLNWEHQNADALLQAWFPGEQGGKAIADVIFGNYNPSGRLPVTYYKSIEHIPAIDDYSMKGHTYRYFDGEALYPFGYGLSYTHFSYSNLRVNPGSSSTKGKVGVQADVTNTGSHAGDEAVQLYISKDKRDDISPIRQLKGFRKLSLKPGETRTVTFTLDPRSFALVDSRGDLRVGAGSYTISVGGMQPEAKSIANAKTTGVVSGKVTLSGETNYLAKDRPYPHE